MNSVLMFLKIVIYIIVSFASIVFVVDFITLWEKKGKRKKLLLVSLVIWIIVIGLRIFITWI